MAKTKKLLVSLPDNLRKKTRKELKKKCRSLGKLRRVRKSDGFFILKLPRTLVESVILYLEYSGVSARRIEKHRAPL